MKAFVYIIVLFAIAASGASCASIVTRSIYPADFNSEPQGAQLTIENRDGRVVFTGHTPSTVWLEASAGYMRPERYKVTYRLPGREPVTAQINARIEGWYFGNLFFGGVIGMLLVDPLTGAMWKIPPHSEVMNVTSGAETPATEPPVAPAVPSEPPAATAIPAVPAVAGPPAEPATAPAAPADGWSPLGD